MLVNQVFKLSLSFIQSELKSAHIMCLLRQLALQCLIFNLHLLPKLFQFLDVRIILERLRICASVIGHTDSWRVSAFRRNLGGLQSGLLNG